MHYGKKWNPKIYIYVLFYTLKKELFFAIRALLDWEVKSTSQLINSMYEYAGYLQYQ
jgi:hypothetical protein